MGGAGRRHDGRCTHIHHREARKVTLRRSINRSGIYPIPGEMQELAEDFESM
jgi:hypothetical protein